MVGYTLARPVDGRMWARHSQIAQSLAGDDGGTRAASLENNLGNIELRAGRLEQARAHLGTAVAEMTRRARDRVDARRGPTSRG